ncbi:unnamed protein product [Durusdinium trenchii]|uniref:Uncharacterized protein n=1 Tax=Durusdinium trenchii TaxID=1381693 RepID=A0ABP0KT91_9DINO
MVSLARRTHWYMRIEMSARSSFVQPWSLLVKFKSLTDLDDWYEWFWGKDIAERRPPPPESTLVYAERNAWREIHNKVYEGATLKDAMQDLRQDSLFWTREVYERCQTRGNSQTPIKGKSKGQKGTTWTTRQINGLASTDAPCSDMALLRRVDCLRALIREQSTLRQAYQTPDRPDMPPTQRALNQWTGNEADAWLELQREGKEVEHDLLRDQPYSDLCNRALAGQREGGGGGPNCRAWSILRWIPKACAPPPVRGRKEPHCWVEGLKASDQQLVDDDSRAKPKSPAPWNFLEHPVDPKDNSITPSAWRCSSIWATRALRTRRHLLGNTLITFDQCRLGQVVKKTTTLSTNLHLQHWHGMVCDHDPDDHKQSDTLTSSDLSRYPWDMMHGLASAIHEHQMRSLLPGAPTEPAVASCTDNGPGASKKPRLGDTSKAGLPVTPGNQQDCQKLAQTPKQGQHSACGTSWEADGPSRPIMDHPSEEGVQSVTKFQGSINQHEKQRAFPDALLREVRHILVGPDKDAVHQGQPFYLEAIHDLAKQMNDVDQDYPLILREGEDLTMEFLPPPPGRANYSSAEQFIEEIKETFREERELERQLPTVDTASAMIPALELLGSLILISFILKMGERHQLAIKIPVITDNQGNVFCMLSNKTRQMPTSAILMQLVLTLHKRGLSLPPAT